MKLVLVTRNRGKLAEIRNLLPNGFETLGLDELGFHEQIPETGNTFSQNALEKALLIHRKYGFACLADDSGLEVKALGGRPGIFSARYAGEGATDAENNLKLLEELGNTADRSARFFCCIVLVINKLDYLFQGELSGSIAHKPSGTGGFGYDPIFIPSGADRTLAEFSAEEKNRISHRAKALEALKIFFR